MKTICIMAACALFASCSLNLHPDDENNLTSKFNGTWNIHEGIDRDINGVITYNALPWGGLVASVKERNMPVALSLPNPQRCLLRLWFQINLRRWVKQVLLL